MNVMKEEYEKSHKRKKSGELKINASQNQSTDDSQILEFNL